VARVPLEERRQQIISAGKQVIARHGIEGATTRRIAAAADAPLATLHYCFGSKEGLLWAMWEAHLHSLLTEAPSRPANRGGLARSAADELRFAIARLVEDEELAVTSMELLLWARRQEPALGQRAYEMYFAASIEHLASELSPGESEQLVAPLARLIAAAYDGIVLQWITFHDPAWRDQAVDMWAEAIELYVREHTGPDRGTLGEM
jgi:AcrR family transcriptional regulator